MINKIKKRNTSWWLSAAFEHQQVWAEVPSHCWLNFSFHCRWDGHSSITLFSQKLHPQKLLWVSRSEEKQRCLPHRGRCRSRKSPDEDQRDGRVARTRILDFCEPGGSSVPHEVKCLSYGWTIVGFPSTIGPAYLTLAGVCKVKVEVPVSSPRHDVVVTSPRCWSEHCPWGTCHCPGQRSPFSLSPAKYEEAARLLHLS